MRKVLGKMKRTLSMLLTAAMIVTGLPQTSAIAYAAEVQNVLTEDGRSNETGDGTRSVDNGAASTGESGSGDAESSGENRTETGAPSETGSGETETSGENQGSDESGSEGTGTPDGTQAPEEGGQE